VKDVKKTQKFLERTNYFFTDLGNEKSNQRSTYYNTNKNPKKLTSILGTITFLGCFPNLFTFLPTPNWFVYAYRPSKEYPTKDRNG
jgi:hypothetical protein